MSTLDVDWVRGQFPALALQVNGRPAVYFDGPGGTQVPQRVKGAMLRIGLVQYNTAEEVDRLLASLHELRG